MTASTAEARELASDAVRRAQHVALEASRLKTVATEAVEDGVRSAKRAITHGVNELGDLRDQASYRVKRAPLTAVGLAFATGILLGAVIGKVTRKAVPDR